MGRKANNMPVRMVRKKKVKDPNNFQIRGKAGNGRLRERGRLLRHKQHTKKQIQAERGMLPDAPKPKERPMSYLELAKKQEERVSEADPQVQQAESKSARKKKRKKGDNQEPETDLLERSRRPDAEVRKGSVDLGADEGEGTADLAPRAEKKRTPATTYCPSFSSSGVLTSGTESGELWLGACVRLVGLQGAAELNGKTGVCSGWDESKERWLVRLDGHVEEKALKPCNLRLRGAQQAVTLRPGSLIRIFGLQGAALLNGESGTCISWVKGKQRWRVRLELGSERLLRPEKLKLQGTQEGTVLRVGSSVCLTGLYAAPDLNGKLGVCLGWDEGRERWRVRLEGGTERLLKPENLDVDSTPEQLTVSPLIRHMVTVCTEEEKLEQLLLLVKKLVLEEKKSLRPRTLKVIFCKKAQGTKSVAEALVQAQIPCSVLHSEVHKAKRDSVLAAFHLDKKTIVAVTDGSTRGLKNEHLRTIINYDFPRGMGQYGDRIRRVLHQEAEGLAHSFFTKDSASLAPQLISFLEGAKAEVEPALRKLATETA